MYSRNYYPDRPDRLSLPENYDGTAFIERQDRDNSPPEQMTESQYSEESAAVHNMSDGGSARKSQVGGSILSSLFQGNSLFGNIGLSMPNLGGEEILIIATAAFLFFSKNGDRECALILLLLLFIN